MTTPPDTKATELSDETARYLAMLLAASIDPHDDPEMRAACEHFRSMAADLARLSQQAASQAPQGGEAQADQGKEFLSRKLGEVERERLEAKKRVAELEAELTELRKKFSAEVLRHGENLLSLATVTRERDEARSQRSVYRRELRRVAAKQREVLAQMRDTQRSQVETMTLYRTQRGQIDSLTRELAATRKAKQENDDRFMGERDQARRELAEAKAQCDSLDRRWSNIHEHDANVIESQARELTEAREELRLRWIELTPEQRDRIHAHRAKTSGAAGTAEFAVASGIPTAEKPAPSELTTKGGDAMQPGLPTTIEPAGGRVGTDSPPKEVVPSPGRESPTSDQCRQSDGHRARTRDPPAQASLAHAGRRD